MTSINRRRGKNGLIEHKLSVATIKSIKRDDWRIAVNCARNQRRA